MSPDYAWSRQFIFHVDRFVVPEILRHSVVLGKFLLSGEWSILE